MTTDPKEFAAGYGQALRKTGLPTPEQLKAYADRLPDIYRDVLSAFAGVPLRKEGRPVPAATIRAILREQGKDYVEPEFDLAVVKLIGGGLLDHSEYLEFLTPTPVGEALITALTGKPAVPVVVPDLPTW